METQEFVTLNAYVSAMGETSVPHVRSMEPSYGGIADPRWCQATACNDVLCHANLILRATSARPGTKDGPGMNDTRIPAPIFPQIILSEKKVTWK